MPGTNVEARRFSVKLPAPPSANQMYRYLVVNKLVRPVPSKAYVSWKKAAKSALSPGDENLFKGSEQLSWSLVLYANLSHVRDLDNAAKAVIDMIAKHYALSDKWLDRIYLERTTKGVDGRGLLFDTCEAAFMVFDTGKRKVVKGGQAGDELHTE